MKDGAPTRIASMALALCVATGLGWWGSTLVRSPSQVIADMRPPAPSILTESVRRAPLQAHVVAVGEVSLGPTYKLTIPGAGVLTSLDVSPSQTILAGRQVATVNDRPVLVLQDRIPLWRDLAQGDIGRDVARLQQALRRAGYVIADPIGTYGISTSNAIDGLYARVGSTPAQAGLVEVPTPPFREKQSSGYSTGSEVRAHMGAQNVREMQTVSRNEIVMVPELPAQVARVDAALGSVDANRSLLLAFKTPEIRATLTVGDAKRIKVGDPVSIKPEGDAAPFRGEVQSISEPKMDPEEGYVTALVVRPRRPLPISQDGRQVQLTVKGSRSPSSLIVPITAVWQEAGGGTHLVVVEQGGSRRVPVTVAEEANGSAAVEPISVGDLHAGDQVRIGVR